MAIVVSQGISGKCFSANVPDLMFSIDGPKARVTMYVAGSEKYCETLYAVGGVVEVCSLDEFVTPYAREKIVFAFSVKIEELNESGEVQNANEDNSCTVVYSAADVDIACETFCTNNFLSLLQGEKITAMGRLEYLHYHGSETATVTAYYTDGTQGSFAATMVSGNENIKTIDVSPERFAASGKTLVRFVVACGSRQQRYRLDLEKPDCAPILIFENSFGCEELIYCTGTHKVNPKYERSSARLKGKLRNYAIEEKRTFEANTGILNTAMANWADDLFRSKSVRVVNIYSGTPQIGKEITITDSKSDHSNDDTEMPSFTFSYQYAQRNHNVIDTKRAGRIFDNTFDMTFN